MHFESVELQKGQFLFHDKLSSLVPFFIYIADFFWCTTWKGIRRTSDGSCLILSGGSDGRNRWPIAYNNDKNEKENSTNGSTDQWTTWNLSVSLHAVCAFATATAAPVTTAATTVDEDDRNVER